MKLYHKAQVWILSIYQRICKLPHNKNNRTGRYKWNAALILVTEARKLPNPLANKQTCLSGDDSQRVIPKGPKSAKA
jgi:hypothetical protein